MCLEIGRNISQKLTYEGMWRWNAKRFVHSCASIALFVFGCLHSHRFRSSCCTHRLPPVPICQRSHTHSLKFLVNVCVVYLFPVTQLVEDSFMTAVLLIYWFICCRGNILIVLATSFGEYYQREWLAFRTRFRLQSSMRNPLLHITALLFGKGVSF